MLVRVSVRFPHGDEVRYLERAPALRSTIKGQGADWIVTDVDIDTAGGYMIGVRPKRKLFRRGGRS